MSIDANRTYHCSIERHAALADCLAIFRHVDSVIEDATASGFERRVPCLLSRLKGRILRLRAGMSEDWPFFSLEVERHGEFLAEVLDVRDFLTIVHGYADFGSAAERAAASAVSAVAHLDTASRITASAELAQPDVNEDISKRNLGGGLTATFAQEDSPILPALFRRISRGLRVNAGLAVIGRALLSKLLDDEQSLCARIEHAAGWPLRRAMITALDEGLAETSGARRASGEDISEELESLLQRSTAQAHEQNRELVNDLLRRLVDRFAQSAERERAIIEAISGMRDSLSDSLLDGVSHLLDLQFQDVILLLEQIKPVLPPPRFKLETDHPLAFDSTDHAHPRGTARDNTRAPQLVFAAERQFGSALNVLDLGCSGGGLVFDFSLHGHNAVGLEGSDYSLRRQRAAWRLIGDRLFTCDIRQPFALRDTGNSERAQFHLIMIWEVLEHIEPSDLTAVLDNVARHLRADGLFIGSVCTVAAPPAPDGAQYHKTVKPREWWLKTFAAHRLTPREGTHFNPVDFPRGTGAPYSRKNYLEDPALGFHFVLGMDES